ncbi:hypothetical protein [Chryseobacterium luquanense]|uniref:Uncharacterized protein n=1 Tax=Chryseobacterium luquanense TaxID=2983766 RepID=A0ABT3Y006_9FLAO|nr:hypothetical protein [Chryseobacterium luquanense]MCX8531470.1 hypothetical protein [Chryseobacterium luquanense]
MSFLGVAIDPLKAVLTNNNIYVNKKLGIYFVKPENWGFIAVKDFGTLKNKQLIGSGLEEDSDEIWKELGDPICMITKFYENAPEYYGIFSPTITLNVTPKSELEYLGCVTFEEIIEMSAIGTSSLLKDFKIIREYIPYTINNIKFHEFDAEYLFEHIEIDKPLLVELKILKTEHNGYYYDFNFHQSKTQNQTAEVEFQKFISSIQLI